MKKQLDTRSATRLDADALTRVRGGRWRDQWKASGFDGKGNDVVTEVIVVAEELKHR